eukprot:scaffold4.g4909.t1
MFEAFRCAKPDAAAARAAAATTASAGKGSGSPSRAAKRQRLQQPADRAAPAPPTDAPPPVGGLPEKLGEGAPLRLIIVGHNPSETAWRQGHYYANSSNHLWRILGETGIAPWPAPAPVDDDRLPAEAGVGFTDVGSGVPGTDSSKFTSADFKVWRTSFFQRLVAHAARAARALGCTCGACGAPAIVAFSGKRQFAELFVAPPGGGGGGGRGRGASAAAGASSRAAAAASSDGGGEGGEGGEGDQHAPCVRARRPASIAPGRQWVLPEGWPLPLEGTEVWVMTSTSGAAAMTKEQRYAPWRALAERLAREPWPRPAGPPRCRAAR